MFSFSPTVNFGGLLGQPFGSQVAYKTILGAEEQQRFNGTLRRVKLRWFPITFMDQYCNKSFEELRFEDYSIGRKSSLNRILSKDDDLTAVAMANFIPQTYTNVSDVKMSDDTGGSGFGSLNNCFSNNRMCGASLNNSFNETQNNLFSQFSSLSPTTTSTSTTATGNILGNSSLFSPTPQLSSSPAPIFNFQNTFGNSHTSSNSTTTSSNPMFSFSSGNNAVPSSAMFSTFPQSFVPSSPSPSTNIFGPRTIPQSNQCIPINTQVGTSQLPTYIGPKLYPIFNGSNLVGYTMNDIAFNPSTKIETENTTRSSSAVDDEVASAWNKFYEHCQAHQLKLFPTSMPGQFMLDMDPKIRYQGRCTCDAYNNLWNNPYYHQQPENCVDKISSSSSSSNPYWEQLDLKQLTTPYKDAKFDQKCRRSLLKTAKIFPSFVHQQQHHHQQQNSAITKVDQNNLTFPPLKPEQVKKLNLSKTSITKVTRKVNHFRQQQPSPQVETNYEPLQQQQSVANNDDVPHLNDENGKKKPNGLRTPVTSFVVDKMSRGEAVQHDDNDDDLNIKTKESEDNVNNDFKTIVGTDAENVKIIDRSRRPRSKSLSLRPGGKSCGVHLTRDRYYCLPSIQAMDTMVDECGRCIVENFEIGHMDFGHMIFDGKMDVAGINLDEIVVFNLKEMFLYPATDQDCDLPLCLQKLNQPAMVTLLQVWPQRHGTNEFIRDLNAIKSINYEYLLLKTCERMGVTFVTYDPVKGHWQFRIQDNMVPQA